jgi:hypothetical protein
LSESGPCPRFVVGFGLACPRFGVACPHFGVANTRTHTDPHDLHNILMLCFGMVLLIRYWLRQCKLRMHWLVLSEAQAYQNAGTANTTHYQRSLSEGPTRELRLASPSSNVYIVYLTTSQVHGVALP